AQGPSRAGQPGEELSLRHRELGVSRGGQGLTDQGVRVTPGRCCGAPQFLAPGATGAGKRRDREQRRWAFLETRGTSESGAKGRSNTFPWPAALKGLGSEQLPAEASSLRRSPQPQ
ncbi:hypothetical protein H1C71_029672, partial [Ictidomys tridecemlineatus]